jgi:hypothetical protein
MSSATPQQKLAFLAELFVNGNLTESGFWTECSLLIQTPTPVCDDKVFTTQVDEAEDHPEDQSEEEQEPQDTHSEERHGYFGNEYTAPPTPFISGGKTLSRKHDSDEVTDVNNTIVGKIGELECLIKNGEDPWTRICTDKNGNTYEIASPDLQALTGFGIQRWRQAASGGGCYILRNGLPIYKAMKKENHFIKAVGLRIRNKGDRCMVECVNRVAKSGTETILPIDWNVGGGTIWRMGAEGKIN